jgi:hypothetical protein
MNTTQDRTNVPSAVKPRAMQEKNAGEEFRIVIELDEVQLKQVAGGKFIKIDY